MRLKMEENKPTVINIEQRMRQLMLGINAMVSLAEYLSLEDKAPNENAFDELLKAMDIDLEERFIQEFTNAGITGEA